MQIISRLIDGKIRIVNKNEWIIGLGPQHSLPEVDPGNREALLSIGAFAENLSLAAGTYGLKAEMEIRGFKGWFVIIICPKTIVFI